jgi:hypothetical protein
MGWFGKSRNKRTRDVVRLDVKLRNERAREERFKILSAAFGVFFALVVVVFGVWRGGEWILNQTIFGSERFAITEIDVRTDGVIAPEHLVKWAGVRKGQNILALDLWELKRNLQLVPVIRSANVERILPGTLKINVVEREPVAQIVSLVADPKLGWQNRVLHVDTNGHVNLPLDRRLAADPASLPDDSLPMLTGVNVAELGVDKDLSSPQVRAALRLIDLFEGSDMASIAELRRIDVSAADVLTVVTGGGAEVTFGVRDFERQLRRWREICDVGFRLGRCIGTIDLSVTHNIPVRWIEAGQAPPQNPTPVKPNRHRRKNVR